MKVRDIHVVEASLHMQKQATLDLAKRLYEAAMSGCTHVYLHGKLTPIEEVTPLVAEAAEKAVDSDEGYE